MGDYTKIIKKILRENGCAFERQVKASKIYFRDSGILHHLLAITDMERLMTGPRLGASWEGFTME